MRGPEETIVLPGACATLRRLPGRRADRCVIFFHGMLGDSDQWEVFEAHASPRGYAECWRLDFHFERERLEPLTFEGIIAETEALLAEAERRRAAAHPAAGPARRFMVGSSFGGHIAMHFAARGGAWRPDGLVLFAPGGYPEATRRRGLLQSFRTAGKIFDVSFDRIFSTPRVRENARVRELLRVYRERLAPHKRMFIRNLIGLSRSVRRCELSHAELARITAHTLLVWGRHDIVTPPEVCAALASHVPGAHVAWVEAGHAAHVECPAESSRILRSFCVSPETWRADAAASGEPAAALAI